MHTLLKTLALMGLLGCFPMLQAQEGEELLEKARKDLEVLTSDEFGGRGYQSGGHNKAAEFVAKRFDDLGLDKAAYDLRGRESYFQAFDFGLNLVREASLTINGDVMEPGRDFIVNRYSGTAQLENVKVVDMKYGLDLKPKFEGKVVMIREGLPPKIANDPAKKADYEDQASDLAKIQRLLSYRPAAIIILKNKLTSALAKEAFSIPILEVHAEDLQGKPKKVSMDVKTGTTNISTQNVAGIVRGTTDSDSFLLVCAHYDHLGAYSGAVFAGANDNASGTVMMLSMAEYFSQNPLKHPILFMAFAGEEIGLKGSRFYVEKQPIIPLRQIKFVLNLDLMGNGEDGIMAVCGKDYPELFQKLVDLNAEKGELTAVKARKNAPNSDHYFFAARGVPAFFIYTMGGPAFYHDVDDTADNLQFSRYIEVRDLLIRFLSAL